MVAVKVITDVRSDDEGETDNTAGETGEDESDLSRQVSAVSAASATSGFDAARHELSSGNDEVLYSRKGPLSGNGFVVGSGALGLSGLGIGTTSENGHANGTLHEGSDEDKWVRVEGKKEI